MKTVKIVKKASASAFATLKSATRDMSWGDSFLYFEDGDALSGMQKGFPASMEYMIEEGDKVIEVDSEGNEIGSCVFEE